MTVLSQSLSPPADRPERKASSLAAVWNRIRHRAFVWQYGGDANARRSLRMLDVPVDAEGYSRLRLRGLPSPLYIRAGPGCDDRGTVWEIFHHRVYDGVLPFDYRTVLDLGANVGLTLAYLVFRRTPLERYIGVEADPETFAVLRKQVEALGVADRCTLLNVAVSDREATLRFSTSGQSVLHALRENGNLEVPARPVATLLDQAGVDQVDLMKLDIEGGEREVVADAPNWASRVKRIAAELHFDMDAEWLRAHLQPLGFRVFPRGQLFRDTVGAIREDVPLDRQ